MVAPTLGSVDVEERGGGSIDQMDRLSIEYSGIVTTSYYCF